MPLIVSVFVAQIALSAAATISVDHEDVPVRRQVSKIKEQPLMETAMDSETDAETDVETEDWPHCEALNDHNWNTADKGAELNLHKIDLVPNVTSAQKCADLCGSHNGKVPCAGWTWVDKKWAAEFSGHKGWFSGHKSGYQNCAKFGFVKDAAGGQRAAAVELAYPNKCCTMGTPCRGSEKLSYKRLANDDHHKQRKEARRREKEQRIAAENAAEAANAQEQQQDKPHLTRQWVVFAIASVILFGSIGVACAVLQARKK